MAKVALAALIVAFAAIAPDFAHLVRYKNQVKTFEDYLSHMDKKLQTSIVKLGGENGNEAANVQQDGSHHNSNNHSILSEIPHSNRQNVTCCMLGELAGDKGFHCYADFYAARLLIRNRNRPHNDKLGFYGRFRTPNFGEKLMRTFEQCVATQGNVFHRCCYLVTLEKQDRRKHVARPATSKGKGPMRSQRRGAPANGVARSHHQYDIAAVAPDEISESIEK